MCYIKMKQSIDLSYISLLDRFWLTKNWLNKFDPASPIRIERVTSNQYPLANLWCYCLGPCPSQLENSWLQNTSFKDGVFVSLLFVLCPLAEIFLLLQWSIASPKDPFNSVKLHPCRSSLQQRKGSPFG